jgi:hypothetical protein
MTLTHPETSALVVLPVMVEDREDQFGEREDSVSSDVKPFRGDWNTSGRLRRNSGAQCPVQLG